MTEDLVLYDRSQCPLCHADLEMTGLMDEETWDSMTVSSRVALMKLAGLEGKHGGKSYEQLDKLTNDELLAICNYKCNSCGTDWPAQDLLGATSTPNQLDMFNNRRRLAGEED